MILIKPLPSGPLPDVEVSVVITCHNYGRFLDNAVDSVVTQRDVRTHIVVVDDASTDDSLEVARGLARRHPQIEIVALATTVGPVAAANEALSRAKAPLVVKLDADDALAPGSLGRAIRLMQQFPSAVLAYGGVRVFHEQVPRDPAPDASWWIVWAGGEWLETRFRRPHATIRQPEAIMRRDALDIVGHHRAHIPAASDFAMWLRLATAGSIAYIGGTVQGYYRIHDASLQRTVHAGLLNDLRERIAAFDNLFEERGDHISDVAAHQRQVRRAFAHDAVRVAVQCLDRGEPPATVSACLSIARSQDPEITRSAAWSAVRLRQRFQTSPKPASPLAPGSVARDLEYRARYRLWQWCGL